MSKQTVWRCDLCHTVTDDPDHWYATLDNRFHICPDCANAVQNAFNRGPLIGMD